MIVVKKPVLSLFISVILALGVLLSFTGVSLAYDKKPPCNIITFTPPVFTVLGQIGGNTFYKADIAWQSKTGGTKSISFWHYYHPFPMWQNVTGKSGTVSFFYTAPSIGIFGYEVASYTKPDMGGEVCMHLIVDSL